MEAFIRRTLPMVVLIGVGALVLLGEFVGDDRSNVSKTLVNWAAILFAFALLLGLVNLLAVHWRHIRERSEGWPYSLVLIGTVFAVLCAGLGGVDAPPLQWIFQNVQTPLETTLLSLLVFVIVSATTRVARLRSWGVALMLGTAAVILLGQMPFADRLGRELGDLQQWIVDVPVMAGQRGILLGVALGVIAAGLRLLFGVERENFFH
ncbi:MAG: hypothetical protein ABI874_07145 [Chloroflexota bacterium]